MHYLYEYGTPGSQLFITFLDGQKSAPEKKKQNIRLQKQWTKQTEAMG